MDPNFYILLYELSPTILYENIMPPLPTFWHDPHPLSWPPLLPPPPAPRELRFDPRFDPLRSIVEHRRERMITDEVMLRTAVTDFISWYGPNWLA